tara:strand:+ start:37 stop:1863 length:1827 start_codon:yes stop_codon:yes gene_type:complete
MVNDPGKNSRKSRTSEIVNPLIDGMALDHPAVTIVYAAGPITQVHLEKSGGGDLEVYIEGARHTFTAASVSLTAGTTTVPTLNHVWIALSSGVLVLSAGTAYPTSGEYMAVAEVLLQTHADAQANGVYKLHAWTDEVGAHTGGTGHMAHVNSWIRHQSSTWISGVTPTVTVVGASSPDDVYIATTAGVALQLHEHDLPAKDMATGSDCHVVNDSAAAYTRVTNLNTLLTDASGGSMSGRSFSLVFWMVVSENSSPSHLMVNLPTDSYSGSAAALLDAEAYSVYAIPADFKGAAFLFARVTFSHSPSGGGSWTVRETEDLRGTIPNTVAGSSSATTDLHIGNKEIQLEANRNVTLASGTDYYLYLNLIDDTGANDQTASIIVQPSVPRVVVSAVEATVSSTGFACGSDYLDIQISAGAGQQINGDAGTAGDQYQCGGAGNPPVWASGMVHSATAPNTAQLWFHTTDNVVYYYDSTRVKWLSVNEYTVDAASTTASSTSNAILQQHGVSLLVSSSERGHPLPYDCTVTGWYWKHGGTAVAARELALGRFDVSAGTNNTRHYSVTPAAWQEFQEQDLDEDFDTQDCLGLIAYGTTVLVYTRCTVTYRRRPS